MRAIYGSASISWRHRLTVTVPGSVLGVFDNAVAVATLGFVQPGWEMSWMFAQAFRNARRADESETP